MNLFKLIGHTYDKGYHHNMRKTGEMVKPELLINPDDISYVEHWKGENLSAGLTGVKIVMKTNGKSFVDSRSMSILETDLDEFKKR